MMSNDPAGAADILWLQTTTGQKLDCLQQLFDKQPDLRVQFAQFSGMDDSVPKPVFFTAAHNAATVEEVSVSVFSALSSLRFDENELYMNGSGYYSEADYSDDLTVPDPLIESVLADYADQVINALGEGRLTDAMPVYLGVYEGTQAATEPEDDEFDIISDYPSLTWAVWHGLLSNAYTQLAIRVLHPDQITLALIKLNERIQQVDTDEEEAADSEDDDDFQDDQDAEPIYYNLKSFEPLLLALVTDATSARAMQQAIVQYSWQNRGTEYVQLRIADVLSDAEHWLNIADQFADQDAYIGLQLLHRQRQMGNRPVLLQTVYRLSSKFPKTFDAFILETFDETLPAPDLNLYLNALENRCRSAGQLPDYLKLRTFWTENERRSFTDSLQTPYVLISLFYAQVLHTEGRSDDLFAWLETVSWQYARSLPDILPLAAQTHPTECLNLTTKRAANLLQTSKRDRTLYSTIASWLAALHTIPSLKPQVSLFARQLVSTHTRLTALRDELRMKGLV